MALRQQGEEAGLKGHHAHSGVLCLQIPAQLTVPPVPTPATKQPPSSVSAQISGRWSSRVPLDWRGFQTVLR